MAEDKIDPICGMVGTIQAHNHYFCSKHCLLKYEEMHHLEKEECTACAVVSKKWYRENLFLVVLGLLIIWVSQVVFHHFGLTVLDRLVFSFYQYFRKIWIAVLVGLLIGGLIDRFVPREYISRYLAGTRKKTIFYSAGLGFLLSACSHGILAISMEIYKKGASVPAVITFLLASPWANLPVTVMLFGFFGWKALFFVVSAIVIAIITGLVYQVLDKKGLIEKNVHTLELEENFSLSRDIKRRFGEYKFSPGNVKDDLTGVLAGSWSLARMVLWWILVGMFLASLSSAYVPSHFFRHYLGPNLAGLLVTLLLATVIEVCSEGSSPLAFEIYRQTGAFGNSMVFLMAGVATDYTEIGLIWSNIGKKSALWLPAVTVPQVIILGYVFNLFL